MSINKDTQKITSKKVIFQNNRYLVEKSLELFSPDEQKILKIRFGLDGYHPHSLRAVADKVKKPYSYIQQFIKEALKRMEKELRKTPVIK
jgi:DNA-directed RNA polymerase sigma subunit (sigma70/sigma32)